MLDMTNHFHQSNLIEGFDSPEADACLKNAWEYLIKQEKITKTVICKTQKLATLHQKELLPSWRGYYRKIDVWIAGRKGLNSKVIETAMDNWINFSVIEATPQSAHIQFETIHPFVDGNGRTGRLLMWWHQLQRGEQPILITYDERFEYYEWFK